MPKDYYKILGVHRGASADEIKKAFRRLAHQYHPDKKGGDERRFKEINEAYQVLSDAKKRAEYDRFGTTEHMGAGFGGAAGPFRWDAGGFGFGGPYTDPADINEIFDSFFEGFGIRPRRRTYRRGSDLEATEEITLEEAFRGVRKELRFTTYVRCESCKGVGADPAAGSRRCETCGGRGEIQEERRTFFGTFSQRKACEKCRGVGEVPNRICGVCKGNGRVLKDVSVQVVILPGIEDGQILTVKGAGEAGERGTAPGDLYVRVRVAPHRLFERRGDDLVVIREIKALDLLLGRPIAVPTIEGSIRNIEIPPHFNLSEPLRIPGEGMPHMGRSGRGDLLVRFIVKTPKRVPPHARRLLENLEGEIG